MPPLLSRTTRIACLALSTLLCLSCLGSLLLGFDHVAHSVANPNEVVAAAAR